MRSAEASDIIDAKRAGGCDCCTLVTSVRRPPVVEHGRPDPGFRIEEFWWATWDQRIQWVRALQSNYRLGGWFDNFYGVLRYFQSSPTFSNEDWAKISDGSILWTIQAGLREYRQSGSVSLAWSRFFRGYFVRVVETRLRAMWGTAEQQAVDFGVGMADLARRRPSGDAGELTRWFIVAGNVYRSSITASKPLSIPGCARGYGFVGTSGPADPREDEQVVYKNAVALERFFFSVDWKNFLGAAGRCLIATFPKIIAFG